MRILLVSPLPPPEGGIAIWTKQYIEYCKKIGIDAAVVNIALTGRRSEKINSSRSVFDEIKRTVNIIRDLKHQLKTFKPECVHINSSCAKWGLFRDYICASIVKYNGVRLVLHYRCTIPDRLGSSSINIKTFVKMSKKADLILTLNKVSENYVCSHIANPKVKTIANFIKLNGELLPHNISPKINTLLYVGHVQLDKGAKEIIETACHFSDKTFILAGPVSNEVLSLKCPSNVRLLGRVEHEEIHNLINISDVFLFPSYTEGFSNALVEAMAGGLPAVASDVGANRDMIEEKGGVIVAPKSTSDIINAIDYLEDEQIRRETSLWNQNKVFNNYRIDTVMKLLFDCYSSL